MALVPCPECGRQVSTAATSCPACGHPLASGAARSGGAPLVDAGLLGKLAAVFGAWLVVPWIARVLVFIAACVVAIVLFTSGRS